MMGSRYIKPGKGEHRSGIRMAAARRAVWVAACVMGCACWWGAAADSSSDGRFVSAACSTRSIPSGSAFWGHLGAALEHLVQETPYTEGLAYATRYGGGDAPAFAFATCPASASPADCATCLRQLSSDIWRICNSALGARVKYNRCYIRYEDYYFSSP